MIKRFLVVLLLLFFVAVLGLFIFLRNVTVRDIAPYTFDYVVKIFASNFASNEKDEKVFESRIKSVISKDQYIDLFDVKIDQSDTSALDLTPFKDRLKNILPPLFKNLPVCDVYEFKTEEFRFCQPPSSILSEETPDFESEKPFEVFATELIDKEIPPRVRLSENLSRLIDIILIIKK